MKSLLGRTKFNVDVGKQKALYINKKKNNYPQINMLIHNTATGINYTKLIYLLEEPQLFFSS